MTDDKRYESPEIEKILLYQRDILTASTSDGEWDDSEGDWEEED